MKKFGLLALPVLAMALAPSAQACSIAPPPSPPQREAGESTAAFDARTAAFHFERFRETELSAARAEARKAGYESALWRASQVVALVEVTATGETAPNDTPFQGLPEVTLKIVSAEKGEPSTRPFKITYEGMTSCGPYGNVSLADGEIGERFVIFATDKTLNMKSVIASYSKDDATDYRTKQLFGE